MVIGIHGCITSVTDSGWALTLNENLSAGRAISTNDHPTIGVFLFMQVFPKITARRTEEREKVRVPFATMMFSAEKRKGIVATWANVGFFIYLPSRCKLFCAIFFLEHLGSLVGL